MAQTVRVEENSDFQQIVISGLGVQCTPDYALFLTPLFRAESGTATSVTRLLRGTPPWGAIDAEKAIPWVKAKTGLTLSSSQREAVILALNSKVVVITGGPGVGKTT